MCISSIFRQRLSIILSNDFSANVSDFPLLLSYHFFFSSSFTLVTICFICYLGSFRFGKSSSLYFKDRRAYIPWMVTVVCFSLRLAQGTLISILLIWLNLSIKGSSSSLINSGLIERLSIVISPLRILISIFFLMPSKYLPRCLIKTVSRMVANILSTSIILYTDINWNIIIAVVIY